MGQEKDLFADYAGQVDEVSHLLFTKNGTGFDFNEAFLGREADLNVGFPGLTVSADFTGDGLDEVALFEEMLYTPNTVPHFSRSIIRINRSRGDHFLPNGSWFSMADSSLDFQHVDFSVAGDYNQDGYSDIALFYNDPDTDLLTVYVLQSEGSGFSDPLVWYTCDRNDFNFTALKFACAGDFNGNGKPDIAVFYNYFGTTPDTRQSVFLFESGGSSFSLLPHVYDATKDTGRLYLVLDDRLIWHLKPIAEEIGWNYVQLLSWCKPNFSGKGRINGDWNFMNEYILLFRKGKRSMMLTSDLTTTHSWFKETAPQTNFKKDYLKKVHPAQMPVNLIRRWISRTPGQVILDPFCGAGSVCIAARDMGRDYIGIELSEEYCKLAEERLALQ